MFVTVRHDEKIAELLRKIEIDDNVFFEGETIKGRIAMEARKLAKFSISPLQFKIRTVPRGIQIWRVK